MAIPTLTARELELFNKKFVRGSDNECWVWLASTMKMGYGQFGVQRDGKLVNMTTHRIAWTLANGPIPAGMCVLHKCDRRACVNPSHLMLGTRGDNIRDAASKGRASCGERHPKSKVNRLQVRIMRRIQGMTHADIGELFGLSRSTVTTIRSGKWWKFMGEPKPEGVMA